MRETAAFLLAELSVVDQGADMTNGPAANDIEALKFRAILQSAVAAVITIDAGGHIETVNPAAEKTFGYAADELIGRNSTCSMPEPYRSQHDSYLDNYLATGRKRSSASAARSSGLRKDGAPSPCTSRRRVRDRGRALLHRHHCRPERATRRRKQRFEREQALFLRSPSQSLPDPLVICDPTGAVRLVNPSFMRVF